MNIQIFILLFIYHIIQVDITERRILDMREISEIIQVSSVNV